MPGQDQEAADTVAVLSRSIALALQPRRLALRSAAKEW